MDSCVLDLNVEPSEEDFGNILVCVFFFHLLGIHSYFDYGTVDGFVGLFDLNVETTAEVTHYLIDLNMEPRLW
jgi:hypothetical protein